MNENKALSEERISELQETLKTAISEIMNDTGSMAYIHASAKKLAAGLKGIGKETTPEELIVQGAFLGYALKILNIKDSEGGENGNT